MIYQIFCNELCDSVEIGNVHINCMMYSDDLIILSETRDYKIQLMDLANTAMSGV